MPLQPVKIIGYAPDLPATTRGILTAVKGIMATPRGISSPPVFTVQTSSTLDTASISGSVAVAGSTGTVKYYIGTFAKIWQYDGVTTLTDRTGSPYNGSFTAGWSFAAFGDIVLASNKQDSIQKSSGAGFTDLASSPKAAIIVNVGPPSAPFIMALNYDDTGLGGNGNTPDGWYCSGISDYTTWNSTAAQSVNGRLLEPTGPFVCGARFRDGIMAWKKNATYRGDYVGSPTVWNWTRIADDVGCCGKNMAVTVHDVCYFADQHGIWKYDGSYPQLLPGYVHDFWANAAAPYIDDSCQMKVDPTNQTLWISYLDASGNRNWLFYNITSQIWGGSTGGAGGELAAIASTVLIKNIVYLAPPTIFAVGGDKKIYTATLNASTSGSGTAIFPELWTWFEGDPEQYIQVDRVRPYFTNTLSGLANQGSSPSTTVGSTCSLVVSADSGLSNTTAQVPAVALDATGGYKFDTLGRPSVAHFVAADMVLLGQWQMSHMALSVRNVGTTGGP